MSDNKSEVKGKAFELYDLRKELMNIDYSLQLVSKNCNVSQPTLDVESGQAFHNNEKVSI